MFNFGSLNLSGVQTSSTGGLDLGRQLVIVTEAKIVPTNSGGSKLEVKLTNPKSKKSMKAWINVHLPSSPKATEIGLETLKTLLVCAHHPSPDHPGDVATLNGLMVGASIRQNGEYKEVHYFFDRDEAEKEAGTQGNSSGKKLQGGLDDDIPF